MIISALLVAVLQTQPQLIGPWTVRESIDPVTDVATTSFLIGNLGDNFGIGCNNGDPNTVTVVWRGRLPFSTADNRYAVGGAVFRFDTDEPTYVMTELPESQRTARVYYGSDGEGIIRRLGSSTRLVLRDALDLPPSRTVVFNYTAAEAEKIVRRIDAVCGTTFSAPPVS